MLDGIHPQGFYDILIDIELPSGGGLAALKVDASSGWIEAMQIEVVPRLPAQGGHDVARHAGARRHEATLDGGVEEQGRRCGRSGGIATEHPRRNLVDQGRGLRSRSLGSVNLTDTPTQQGAESADDQKQERLGERKQFHSEKQEQAGWAGKPQAGIEETK